MRMLYIMAGSLALTLGLRIVDPPAASALPQPAATRASDKVMLLVPRAGSHRADEAGDRKAGRP